MDSIDKGKSDLAELQGKITDIKGHVNRPLFRRLRESYFADMVTILQAAKDGKCSAVEAFNIASDLQARIKILRDGGPMEKMLKKADMVILENVFNDAAGNGEIEQKN